MDEFRQLSCNHGAKPSSRTRTTTQAINCNLMPIHTISKFTPHSWIANICTVNPRPSSKNLSGSPEAHPFL